MEWMSFPNVTNSKTAQVPYSSYIGVWLYLLPGEVWIDDLTEEVKQGDQLKVKVLEIDKEGKKVVVSTKASQETQWLRQNDVIPD